MLFVMTIHLLLLPEMLKGFAEALHAIAMAIVLAILIAIAVLAGLFLLVSGIIVGYVAWKASRSPTAEDC